jgi:5-methylthioadenosine/S-adenosylhomocysteine deaminase
MVYQADWVYPASAAPIHNGVVAVEGGRILHVGPGDADPLRSLTLGLSPSKGESPQRVAYPGCAIIPGFVNAHTHLELTVLRGRLNGLSFPDWILSLTRFKYERCTRETLRLSARLGAIEMLRAGVTAVGEVMDIGAGWEAMLECGLQGIAYQEVFGPAEASAPEALRALQEKVERHRRRETATQRVGVSPHAPYTVSKQLYQNVRDYARHEGLRMTAHIAESRDETQFVRDGEGLFAAAHLKRNIPVAPRGCGPVAHLDSLGLLGSDMLLVHAIETDASELDRMRATGSFVVHCPRSNAYLGHRVAPVAEMLARGIPVSLGTDSVASNDGIDMFEEMRLACKQQQLAFDEVFRMATIEGARALGLDAELGSLEIGKRADFAVVELRVPSAKPVEQMVLSGHSSDVKATFVGGREVTFDEEEIRRIQESLEENFKMR